MARLYADEDCSYPVIQRLRQLGHDLLPVHEASQARQGIEDAAVLAFAMAAGRMESPQGIFQRCVIPRSAMP